jgi:nucleoside-diphosphate-sugar epimerase
MGTGRSYSVNEILEIVSEEINGKDAKFVVDWRPNKEHETQYTLANIIDTTKHFDWTPKVDIRTGISKTVRSIAQELGVQY